MREERFQAKGECMARGHATAWSGLDWNGTCRSLGLSFTLCHVTRGLSIVDTLARALSDRLGRGLAGSLARGGPRHFNCTSTTLGSAWSLGPMASETPLDKQRHVKYWQRCYGSYLPTPYTAADSTKVTLASFVVSALDLLDAPLAAKDRSAIRHWVLGLQHPDGGFCGSSTHVYHGQDAHKGAANIAATFFALILLSIAADGKEEARSAFAGVNRKKLLRWLKALQRDDGSFGQNVWDGRPVGGRDMRHSYLASCVRWMVRGEASEGQEEADVNLEAMIAHIRRGQVCSLLWRSAS